MNRSEMHDDRNDVAPPKSRADLEWARVLGALVDRCETAAGKREARALEPLRQRTEVLDAITQLREAIHADAHAEPLPIPAIADVREAYARALHGGVLAPLELRQIADLLAGVRTLRRFLSARRATMPALHAACSTDPALDDVEEEIASCFEIDGSLSDRASPRLRELRGEHAASRGRMISRIEELMRRYATILQDGFWTEREGRYVMPVRSDSHERFPGIVHAASGSGATLFVEPRVLVPLGNRLKMLEGDVRREEELVYARLTSRIVEVLPSLHGAIDAMTIADLRAASTKLARDLRLNVPDLPIDDESAGFSADLRDLRHPILAIEAFESGKDVRARSRDVVGSDVRVQGGRALVVSGPNAGGKTVALKALGLSALMLRAGLPVAAAEGSTLAIVERVLTDVGDDQSMQMSLSTFSAHVLNLANILEGSAAGTLVLLDELCGGTDPREGEALAAAVLDGLCRRGAAVMATTHYEGLKALALADTRFENASVGFDEATLSPTFRLAIGIPGASSALSVARRFGIPSLVLDRAESYLSSENRTFEQTVRALNDERRALELARAAAEAEFVTTRKLRIGLQEELSTMRDRERQMLSQETESLLAAVRRAREDLRAAQARLRSKKPEADVVRAIDRDVATIASRVAVGGDLEPLILRGEARADRGETVGDETPIKKGAKVWVPKLRAEAEVVEVLSDGQLRVAAGSLKLTLSRAELRVIVDGPKADGTRGAKGAAGRAPILRSIYGRGARDVPRAAPAQTPAPSTDNEPVMQTSENTCDLRGLRVDDAWPMLEAFLDRTLNDGRRLAIVVHGHGTGAVRDHVRAELKNSSYVASYRPGRNDEGGDGVTVVWLA